MGGSEKTLMGGSEKTVSVNKQQSPELLAERQRRWFLLLVNCSVPQTLEAFNVALEVFLCEEKTLY